MAAPIPRLPDYAGFARDALDEALCYLCSHLYAAEYRLLLAIREWDSRELWGLYGVKSTAHWLNYKCGIGLGAAREKVRVARALAGLPDVSAALSRGEISYSKVRAITRVATPDNEAYLLELARHGTASYMERTVSAYVHVERLNDPERILRQRRERGLNWYFDDHGMLVIQGRFPPEEGALLLRAIEAMRERLYREERAQESDDFSEVACGKVERDVTSGIMARRGDALIRLVETGAAAEPRPLGPDRVHVMLHVPVQTGEGEPVDTSEPLQPVDPHPRLDPGTVVSWQTARRLACDAARTLMVESGKGEALSVGRRSRTVPGHIRRALEHRDGGCRFPGCTQQRFVDAHHIHHWADGGETALDNLVLLCRFHHRLVHEEGFGCERTPDGEMVFRTPEGDIMPEAFPLKPHDCVDIATLNRQAGLQITSRTCNGGWKGERMCLSDAVMVLQWKTHRRGYVPPPPRDPM